MQPRRRILYKKKGLMTVFVKEKNNIVCAVFICVFGGLDAVSFLNYEQLWTHFYIGYDSDNDPLYSPSEESDESDSDQYKWLNGKQNVW